MAAKQQIQAFGRTLSAMVMPNIGAFIAWGFITAIFMNGGWWPNENIAHLIAPMLKYLLPLLIAYTAGKNAAGSIRGGVAGAVAAMGVIVGTETPMFLGAMIMGPFAGWCVKKFDNAVKGRIAPGFEMLVDNFSLGIIAMLIAIVGYLLIGQGVDAISKLLSNGVNWMLAHKLNPLLSLIVDPAKVLFLNNAVNHGIMTPLGIEQAANTGHSMLFLVDPNPGPGLGILLACWAFGKGSTRDSAPGAVVIQLFGGIHEIYFPYVLARPVLLLAVIAGNVCALSFFTLLDFGLVAPASPGSLISIILMSPKGHTLIGILGVVIATAVSMLVAIPMVKSRPDFQGAAEGVPSDATSSEISGTISKIVFSCDAGMGSSALGATRFKARLMKAGHSEIKCTNSAVDAIPADASVVVCQSQLAERARARVPGVPVVVITNFLNDPALDALLLSVSDETSAVAPPKEIPVLSRSNILVGLPSEGKEEAIRRAGSLLVKGGYVDEGYVDAMIAREGIATTYMGEGLAIPHGTSEAKNKVKNSGIVVLQYPEGVDFDGEKARLIVGIAGVGDSHMEILAKVAGALEDPATLESLCTTSSPEDIYKVLA